MDVGEVGEADDVVLFLLFETEKDDDEDEDVDLDIIWRSVWILDAWITFSVAKLVYPNFSRSANVLFCFSGDVVVAIAAKSW